MKITAVDQFQHCWIAHALVPADDFSRVRETLWGLGCDSHWKLVTPSSGRSYSGKIKIANQRMLASVKLLYGDPNWHVFDAR